MHITQSLHRNVQTGGARIALTFGERQTTWAQLADRAARLAAAMQAMGIKRGDRIAIIAHNCDRYFDYVYASAWIGAVIVPGNTRWSVAEHIYGMDDSETSMLFVDDAHLHLVDELIAARPMKVIYIGDGNAPAGIADLETLVSTHEPIADQCGQNDELFAIFYTGGTTGYPKGVMLSHRSLVMNALYGLATRRESYPPDSVTLHCAPLFHMAAFGSFLVATQMGGSHVLLSSFDPAAVIDAFCNKGANDALFVPTMITMLGEYLAKHPADLSIVRSIAYGASPISEAQLDLAMRIFPNASFTQGYGQSELGPVASSLMPEDHIARDGKRPKLRSAGTAYIGVDIKVVDDSLKELPRGEVGEFMVRHDGIMLGYLNRPEETAATIVDGWVRTGDAGYMDEDGYLFIVDRVKDMIISGGENVFSAEVENALAKHPAVLECVVIGVPDARWGERVHGIVRLHPGASAAGQEFIDHCKALIAGYKCPRSVEIRVEMFPLSAAGKILKRELRKLYL